MLIFENGYYTCSNPLNNPPYFNGSTIVSISEFPQSVTGKELFRRSRDRDYSPEFLKTTKEYHEADHQNIYYSRVFEFNSGFRRAPAVKYTLNDDTVKWLNDNIGSENWDINPISISASVEVFFRLKTHARRFVKVFSDLGKPEKLS